MKLVVLALFAVTDFALADPAGAVRGYLRSLQALNSARMNDFLEKRTANFDMQAFERGTHTKWTWKIQRVAGADVFVDETESSDFYNALGVGRRFQTCVFTVRDGKIVTFDLTSMRHVHGDYHEAYARFLTWLKNQPAANDPRLLRDGKLRFTAESAAAIKPWLKKYARERLAT